MLLEEINLLKSNKVDWSLIISVLALLASAATYLLHDRRLKKQERLINDHQIQKITQEHNENNKAMVKAHVVKHQKGKREIKVFNAGKAVAKNVNLEILTDLNGMSVDNYDIFPYEFMNPQEGTQFLIFLYEGPVNVIKVRTSWDDAHQPGNSYDQMLTL
ncbi:hypothetical protein [Pedobacter jamesrossensis]|uniref:FixH protein n=1 Tax=Pedobacter jamesrossensis TaxID=1908238 RepID=A0ABV8NR99_9SPHI